eukprot:2275583-Pleurochrysis_carterae.AAC.2
MPVLPMRLQASDQPPPLPCYNLPIKDVNIIVERCSSKVSQQETPLIRTVSYTAISHREGARRSASASR